MKRQGQGASIVCQVHQPWAAVPVNIMENRTLSTTARLVLIYLLALNGRGGWEIRVAQVCAALGLGEGAWAAARKQLEASGYYWSEREQKANGKWKWRHVVTNTPIQPGSQRRDPSCTPDPTIPGKSMDGSSGDGSPGHGKPGDIHTNKVHTNKKRTTTEPTATTAELVYPRALGEAEVVVVDDLIAKVPASQCQAVLDELAGAMAKPGRIRASWVAFLRSLVERVQQGEFHPSLGIQVGKTRQQRAEQAKADAKKRAERERRMRDTHSEASQRTSKAELAKLSKHLGMTFADKPDNELRSGQASAAEGG